MSSVSAVAKSQAAPQLDFERCAEAVTAAERLLHLARSGVRKAVEANGSLDASQAAAHGLAWVATYVEALRQMLGWARRLKVAASGRAASSGW
jgi:(2S)-methylsuccinyl-CoA dehydrogenase